MEPTSLPRGETYVLCSAADGPIAVAALHSWSKESLDAEAARRGPDQVLLPDLRLFSTKVPSEQSF